MRLHKPAAAVAPEPSSSCYIGCVLARCILDHCTAIGGFSHAGQLRCIPDIGDAAPVSLPALVAV